jgi:photosystem II stability/assembly factor-like uncharacterized protein
MMALLCITILFSCTNSHKPEMEEEENEEYKAAMERDTLEFLQTRDPALNRVPVERLWDAIAYGKNMINANNLRSSALNWQERGPLFDSVGPSNGNWRGGSTPTGAYASGRINGFIVDASDPTGNTVFCGGAAGGIWKCTNFLSTSDPNWVAVDDYMSNMSIVSFAQNPLNPSIMYCATGEPWNNLGWVRGNGVYKSIDGGATWTQLPGTAGIQRSFKILCDNAGNVYFATAGSGLWRSTDGGNSWTTITPSSVSSSNCTDIEISSTGRLHASFGYGSGAALAHRYTSNPATVTSATWNASTGIRLSGAAGNRMELAVMGDTVYAVTTNTSNNTDSCYRSVNGGVTFTKTNSTIMPSGVANTQGWYNLTLSINPEDGNEILVGGLDAYRSSDGGSTFTRNTYWVSTNPYVHADHHFMTWTLNGTQSRVIMATDGGMFYSTNGGLTYKDRNKNLAIKQFYSCAIHPTLGSNYLIGGAQDNGCHQFRNPGLSYSIEFIGGDGGFVAIDQDEPQFQFGSYVYNVYRRSTDGGNSWSTVTFSSSLGSFINPFEYDNAQNKMYCCYQANNYLRWENPQSGNSFTTISLSELSGGSMSCGTVSPYTTGRLIMGSSNGRIIRINNSATTTGTGSGDVTTLATLVSGGYVSDIAFGTTDNFMCVVYSNYGVNNVWYTSDGGTNWTAIDGNLPDMPVRTVAFHPTNNNKLVIGTEAGVYTTGLVNGASTQWIVSPGFPLVKTMEMRVRKNDNTIVAATHGRGMFSANILDVLPLRDITLSGFLQGDNQSMLTWRSTDPSNRVKYFVQYSTDGINFNQVAEVPANTTSFKHTLNASVGYYRIMGIEPNSAPVFSNIINLKSSRPFKGLQVKITPNPISTNASFTLTSSSSKDYTFQVCNVQGSVLKQGTGSMQGSNSTNIPIDASKLPTGMYVLRIIQGNDRVSSSFIKQ